MTIDWITIAIIIIPSASTLFGSYWQVKTMKKLASPSLNKQNQSSLVNSHNFLIVFDKHPLFLKFLNFILPAFMLIWELSSTQPSSRLSNFIVTFSIGLIFYNIFSNLLFYIVDKIIGFLEKLTKTYKEIIESLVKEVERLNQNMKN